MNAPKEITTYCPKCKTHQAHSVSLYKAGKRRALARGERHHKMDFQPSKMPLVIKQINTMPIPKAISSKTELTISLMIFRWLGASLILRTLGFMSGIPSASGIIVLYKSIKIE
jgi:hypothetical protein